MIVAVSQDKDNAFINLAKSVKSNKIGRFVLVDGTHPSLVKSFSAGSKLNMMILLNVPANISKQFSMAADENAAKEAFTNMMSHKFYVGTINRDKMGMNGATAMDAALGSEEKIIAAFDPHWLEHWRDNAMRVRAVDAWDNVHSDEAKDKQAAAQSDRLIARSERAKREREAQDNIDNASVNKTEAAIKSIIFSAADKESIKNSLSGGISSNKFTRDDALATVEKMKGILNTDTYEFLVNNIKGPSVDSSSDAAAKQAKIDAEKARKANKNKP
jgi:hypothetical protein